MSIYELSYMWYSGVACLIVIFVGIIVSLFTANYYKNQQVDPDLLASGVETLFCCWPRSFKKWISEKKMFSSHKYNKIFLNASKDLEIAE